VKSQEKEHILTWLTGTRVHLSWHKLRNIHMQATGYKLGYISVELCPCDGVQRDRIL